MESPNAKPSEMAPSLFRLLVIPFLLLTYAHAEEPVTGPEDFAAFQELLSGSVLKGSFTITGPEGNVGAPKSEQYEIKQVKMVGEDGRSWILSLIHI